MAKSNVFLDKFCEVWIKLFLNPWEGVEVINSQFYKAKIRPHLL